MNVLGSPRIRRRVGWLLAVAVLAGGVATLVALVPGRSHPRVQGEQLSADVPEPAAPKTQRLTPADRRAINRLLDRFVPAAVARHGTGTSYELATATLRSGATREQWARGDIGVYPFPAAGRSFHGWTLGESTVDHAWIQLLLKPRRGADVGPILFDIELKRLHGRWLVNSFLPTATFAPLDSKPKVTAITDFMPGVQGDGRAPSGKSRVTHAYAALPFALIGLVLLALLGWGLAARYRDRRLARAQTENRLPPLPRPSIRNDGVRDRPAHRP